MTRSPSRPQRLPSPDRRIHQRRTNRDAHQQLKRGHHNFQSRQQRRLQADQTAAPRSRRAKTAPSASLSPLVAGTSTAQSPYRTESPHRKSSISPERDRHHRSSARYAYDVEFSAWTSGLIDAFEINPTTGHLRTLETVQLPSDNFGIVVDPSGKFLYIPNGRKLSGTHRCQRLVAIAHGIALHARWR